MDSTIQSTLYCSSICTAWKLEEFWFLFSRPDDRAIPSGCPSVYCSSIWTTFHSVWMPNRRSVNRLDDVFFCPDPILYQEASVPAFIRPEVQSPWSERVKPYMEITCSRHATVWTTVSHRRDAALKHERFLVKFLKILVALLSVRTAKVHCSDGIRTYYCSHPFCTSAYK
jgi:hypothetical protein